MFGKFFLGSGKPQTTLLKIAFSFLGVPKPELRTPEVKDGWLACAKYVSLVLKEAHLIDQIYISVDSLVSDLKSRGWQTIPKPIAGAVIVWGKTADYSHKHIGIAVNEKEALNNSSYDKMAVKSSIYGERPVELILTRPWSVTRYYTPLPGQKRYYHGSYEADFKINCQGDCFVTASGYRLTSADAYKVAACPKGIDFGTMINLPNIGPVKCVDRGGAIKENRIDVWAGIGDQGLDTIFSRK